MTCRRDKLRELYLSIVEVREELRTVQAKENVRTGSLSAAIDYLGEADLALSVAGKAYDEAVRYQEIKEEDQSCR